MDGILKRYGLVVGGLLLILGTVLVNILTDVGKDFLKPFTSSVTPSPPAGVQAAPGTLGPAPIKLVPESFPSTPPVPFTRPSSANKQLKNQSATLPDDD